MLRFLRFHGCNSSSSSPSLTSNESLERDETRNAINESKRRKLSKRSLDTKHQALLEFLRKEDKHKMEILDADVSFANSIVPMLHSPAAKKKKKPTCKNRNAAGLNEIRI